MHENSAQKTILITGGTGLVGQCLSNLLKEDGYQVHLLSRSPKTTTEEKIFGWNLEKMTIDSEAFKGVQTVVHLAGAGVVDARWTEKRKKVLIDSRVKSANLIWQYLSKNTHTVSSFISASAVGWYPNRHGEIMNVNESPGPDFLAEICVKWEEAAKRFTELGIREARVRISLVLDQGGGVLPNLIRPLKFGIGGFLGSGNNYYSWISNEDLARIFKFLIENEKTQGPYNGAAPENLTQKEMIRELAKAMNKSYLPIPSPEFALKILLGERTSALTQTVRAVPERLLADGFKFKHPKIEQAFQSLLV